MQLRKRRLGGATNGCSIAGLDLIPGNVRSVGVGKNLVLPHVGWNSQIGTPIQTQYRRESLMVATYYVHSYCFERVIQSMLAKTKYGRFYFGGGQKQMLRRAIPPRKKPATRTSIN